MKLKKSFVLAIGIAAAVMAGGCSGRGTEAQTEAGAGQQESSTAPEESQYTDEDSGSDAAEEIPLKITGSILEVGEDTILVDSESDTGYVGEVMLMIDPENTLVLDGVDGFPVELKDVEIGYFEAYLGPAMTMSLPPQTTPFVVIVDIPENVQAPEYIVAGGKVDEAEGKQTLTGLNGAEYLLADSVNITPYLTRNIVKLEDIDSGSRCLVWTNEEGKADRIVLFGE